MNFVKFLRTHFLTEHHRWLLLNFATASSKWLEFCPQIRFPKVFEIIDRMLIGLSFSLRFPEPCLITSVTLAYLEDAGNFDQLIHCMKSVRIQTFIGLYFQIQLRGNYEQKKPVLGHFSQWLLRQFETMFMMIINRIEGEDASESTRLIYSKIVKSLTKI